MVVCPWNDFWQHYSPWTPSEAVVQQGISVLKIAEILIRNKWVDNIDPTTGLNENTGFKLLQGIALNLENMKNIGCQASYRLVHRPNQIAFSTIPSSNHMVDGCFYPIKGFPNGSTPALELQRTASVHEYKPKSNPKHVHDASPSLIYGTLLG